MKRFPKFLLVFGLIAISFAVVVEWVVCNKLKDERRLLAAELASLKSDRETSRQRDQSSTGISQADQEELLKLRSEAILLRARKAELDQLRAQNQRLNASLDSERDNAQERWKLRVSDLRTREMKPADYLGIVPEMAQALTNSDPSVRSEAAKVLRRIGLDRLLNTNLTVQDLADLKSAAKAAVPGLLPVLKDPDSLASANAAITLGFLHENTEQVVPALMENLNSDQVRVAGAAAKALGRLEGDASRAVPALLQLAQSQNPDLRATAIDALKAIDPAAAHNAGLE
jgi:HEAT repeat protein